jgi:flagellar basal-body rod protein FlgF
MADGIYVGMAAAAARTAQLDSVADNLANAQSPGFKASRPAFQSFLPSRGSGDKILTGAVATGTDLTPGVMVPTERALDVVPQRDTFLAVQTAGGGRAYTRNGNIELDPEGLLTIAGHPLLDDKGEPLVLPPGSTNPIISELGDVFVDGDPVGRIGSYAINGPLDRLGGTLLAPAAGAQVTNVIDGTFRSGMLEQGNAPALEATIQMISSQRNFDSAMQAIQTYRKMDERAVEIGRIR